MSSPSKLNHNYTAASNTASANSNGKLSKLSEHIHTQPTQSHCVSSHLPYADEQFKPPSIDKIHLTGSRSSHHEVSADNWRIRYYMNLNLVKQPHHLTMQYKSSSVPETTTPITTADTPTPTIVHSLSDQTKNKKKKKTKHYPSTPTAAQLSARNLTSNQANTFAFSQFAPPSLNTLVTLPHIIPSPTLGNSPIAPIATSNTSRTNTSNSSQSSQSSQTSTASIASTIAPLNCSTHTPNRKHPSLRRRRIQTLKTRSQNNTPPRHFSSLLRTRQRSRWSRMRSRSDGQLSFQAPSSKQKSISTDSPTEEEIAVTTHQEIDEDDSTTQEDSSTTESSLTHDMRSIRNHSEMEQHFHRLFKASNHLTPPATGTTTFVMSGASTCRGAAKPMKANERQSMMYTSPLTPPGNVYMRNGSIGAVRGGRYQARQSRSQSIAVRRSKPVAIGKGKSKGRFDVDFGENSSQSPSGSMVFSVGDEGEVDSMDASYLVDDEANFDMD